MLQPLSEVLNDVGVLLLFWLVYKQILLFQLNPLITAITIITTTILFIPPFINIIPLSTITTTLRLLNHLKPILLLFNSQTKISMQVMIDEMLPMQL